jgi:hypothetical protein
MIRRFSGILRAASLLAFLGLAACGPATLPPGDSIEDANEAQNRAVHRLNVSLDRALVGPTADAYGAVFPNRSGGAFRISPPTSASRDTCSTTFSSSGSTTRHRTR